MKPVVTFIAFAYVISWAIWLPLYGHIFGLIALPRLPIQHALGGLGPLMAAFLTTWIFLKKRGVYTLAKKCFKIRPLLYFTAALFTPYVIAVIAILISNLINKTHTTLSGLLTSKEFPQLTLATIFVYNLIFFGFGEEVGWRGFALPRIQAKTNALTSSIMLTVIWAIWHLPLFLYRPGYMTMNSAGIIGWLLSLLTGSILLTWLYNSTRASILICATFHSTIDIAFTSDIANEYVVMYMGILITVWGIITIAIFKPTDLATVPRTTVPEITVH